MPQRWFLRSSFLKIYKKANSQYNHLGQQTFCPDGCLVRKMFCQASNYGQMLTEQVNILYTFVVKGTLSVQNRFVSDFRPQLLLTAVHCSLHTVVFTTAGWFPKARNQNKFFSFYDMNSFLVQWAGILSWFNWFRIKGQRVWVPFYQPLVTDCQRSLFNENETWRLWVQGSQRNVLKPHKGAEGRMDGDEMGDRETDDIFNLLSM